MTESKDIIVEVAGPDLEFSPAHLADPVVTGRQILAAIGATPIDEHVVIEWLETGDFEEVRPDETVEIKPDRRSRFIIAKADRLYRLTLNDRSIVWPQERITELTLRKIGQVDEKAKIFVERKNAPDEEIEAETPLNLDRGGVENVYSKEPDWRLNVQGVVIVSEQPVIAVREALRKAGFDPERGWIIIFKSRDGKSQVGLDDELDLRLPGIEKLRLTPREINNGEAPARRRAFALLDSDETGLKDRCLSWETITDQGRRWLIIRGYQLPPGFNVAAVDIAMEIPPNYPSAEIDMFYCHPFVQLGNGREIAQTQARQKIENVTFQRWSRHRGAASRWAPGKDSVITHLMLIEAAIAREVE